MSFNADTYAHDVLRMLGYNNIFASAGERYPVTTLEEAVELRPDIVILPDEPYEFDESDVAEIEAAAAARAQPPRADSQRPRPALVRRSHGAGPQVAGGANGARARRGSIIVIRRFRTNEWEIGMIPKISLTAAFLLMMAPPMAMRFESRRCELARR